MDNKEQKGHKNIDLKNYGFEEVGEWMKDDKFKSHINFNISKFQDKRVVYAYVINNEPKYIGICEKDSQDLQGRLSLYRSMAGRSKGSENPTNKRVVGLIKESLDREIKVKILALLPQIEYKHKGLIIDVVKGLENLLLKLCDPEWNRRK